jgi:hypothetical protein
MEESKPFKLDWRVCLAIAVVWHLFFHGFALGNMIGLVITDLTLVWIINSLAAWWHRLGQVHLLKQEIAYYEDKSRTVHSMKHGTVHPRVAVPQVRVEVPEPVELTPEQEWEQQYHEHCQASGQHCNCQACAIVRGL